MKTFYNIISFIFQPLLMPTFGMLLLVNIDVFDLLPFVWKLIAVGGTFLFTGLLPATPILLLIKRGEVHDIFISKREERTLPYLFSLLSYAFWTLFLWRTMHFPVFMIAMAIGSALSIVIITLINLKWKISAHLSGIGALTGGIFGVSYRLAFNPLWLMLLIITISALVAISRIGLRAHTPEQTLAGYCIGFITVFAPCLVF